MSSPFISYNLRPVSTLPFVSKMMESVASKYMLTHMSMHTLHEKKQYAYTDERSTKSALLRIQNDVPMSLDPKKSERCIMLVLLYLSVAFETMYHCIPLQRLSGILAYERKHFSG